LIFASAQSAHELSAFLLLWAPVAHTCRPLETTTRIADVIEREFHLKYHRAHVGRLLATLKWSCQKPERRAVERDPKAIKKWKRYGWPAIKKKPGG
jgi:transposase